MSDQAADQPGGEQGSLNLEVSHSADKPSEPATASTTAASAAADAPVSEPVMSEPSMSEPSLSMPAASEAPKVEAVTAEAKPAEAKPVEASAPASQGEATKDKISHIPAKVIVMSRGEHAWTDNGIHAEPEAKEQRSAFGMRRIAAVAAMLALATAAGAVGGSLATASFMRPTGDVAANTGATSALTASLSRIDGDIQALKTGLDHTSKLGMSQFNKTAERLDKLERAQAEPATKVAKLSEAVDKLQHALPVPPPVVATAAPAVSTAAKETTGSIAGTPAQQQVAAATKSDGKTDIKGDMKSEPGRLPTLDDWVLRDVAYGGAVIGSRRGMYEVYAGDYIPGLGRVDAIRRQDGRWVVVTSRGLIVAR
jgi:hypothetical protein